jgi:hypothetical protein
LNRRRESIIPNEPDPYDFVHGAPLNSRNAGPGEIISIDPNGPVTPAAQGKHPYWFLLKDIGTGHRQAYTTSSLNLQAWKDSVDKSFTWYHKHGKKPKLLRCDAANIPLSEDFKRFGYGTVEV